MSNQFYKNSKSNFDQINKSSRSKIPIPQQKSKTSTKTYSEIDRLSTTTTIIETGPLKSYYDKSGDQQSVKSIFILKNSPPIVVNSPRGVRMTRTAYLRQEKSHLLLNGWGKSKVKTRLIDNFGSAGVDEKSNRSINEVKNRKLVNIQGSK